MRAITIFFICMTMSFTAIGQNTWTVRESAGEGVDFTSITAAIADAQVQTGDVLDILGTFTESNILLSKGLTFQGHGEDQTIIQASADKFDNSGRVFYHDNVGGVDNATITFQDLTVRHANTTFGGYPWAGWGSAMFFLGQVDVVLNNVTVSDNLGAGNGIIYAWTRSLTIDNSEIINNEAVVGRCAGLYLWFQQGYDVEVNITNSVFAENSANDHAGAMAIMKATGTTNKTTVNIENTTFFHNSGFSGSVFWAEAGNSFGGFEVNMTNCTVVNNENTQAGWQGVANFWAPQGDMDFNLKNSFFRGNINTQTTVDEVYDYADFWVPFTAPGLKSCTVENNVAHYIAFHYDGDENPVPPTGYTYANNDADQSLADLAVGTLQDNGGAVRTIALGAGNIAIDKLTDADGVPAKDARGYDRVGPTFDAGAHESDGDLSVAYISEEKATFSFYPNPVNDKIVFQDNLNNGDFVIYDVTGAIVNQGKINNNTIIVDDLNEGVYILQISNERKVYSAKFVKN